MAFTQDQLEELVSRIVAAVHPLRILLFGSAARGETGRSSDLDILVVVPEGTHRRRTVQAIYRQLHGIPVPVDVIAATPSDLEKYRDSPALIYREALREGIELYAA